MTPSGDPFGPLLPVASLLRDFPRPWFIAGGWAIDLFLGERTRRHKDVDVAILRRDQRELHTYLTGWAFEKLVEGRRSPWREGERLNFPIHEIHASRPEGKPRAIEFLLNEAEGDEWIFRRDARITRPLTKVRHVSPSGIPYMAPANVLLYKAKGSTAKDLADFDRVRPHLGFGRRLWLRHALEIAHPGHPWIARL